MMTFSSSSVTEGWLAASPMGPASFLDRAFFSLAKHQTKGEKTFISTERALAENMAKLSEYSLATDLGITSPKMRTTTVITRVETPAPLGPISPVKSRVPMEAAAMLTMLLPMRMVEMALSNRSAIFSAREAFLFPSLASFFRRMRLTVENAVSEAEK